MMPAGAGGREGRVTGRDFVFLGFANQRRVFFIGRVEHD
jgi:hypothetical protein